MAAPADDPDRAERSEDHRRPGAVADRDKWPPHRATRLGVGRTPCARRWPSCPSTRWCVTSLPNILYLTNFSGSTAIVVLDRRELRFITDSPLRDEPYRHAGHRARMPWPAAGAGERVVRRDPCRDDSAARCPAGGRFESGAPHRPPVRLVAGHPRRVRLGAHAGGDREPRRARRVRKDPYELDVLREAGRRLSAVAAEVFTIVRRGRTEQEIAADIDWRFVAPASSVPLSIRLSPVVRTPRCPHARPSRAKIERRRPRRAGLWRGIRLILRRLHPDGGGGAAGPRAREVHHAVLAAQTGSSRARSRPGASRFAIDGAARAALAAAGMGEAFGHGTGHGLGIEIHEEPRIVQRRAGVDTRNEPVESGMVFTIEPGAYFPGWGGVRIEDDIVVTEHGAELLTTVTSDLLDSLTGIEGRSAAPPVRSEPIANGPRPAEADLRLSCRNTGSRNWKSNRRGCDSRSARMQRRPPQLRRRLMGHTRRPPRPGRRRACSHIRRGGHAARHLRPVR